jgi:uncharacterized protein (DUF305 family)
MRWKSVSTRLQLFVAIVALAAASAWGQEQPGHEHAGPSPAEGGETAIYNAADLMFLHHMIIHHAQAVVMAPMVAEHTDREEFVRFADYVGRGQAAEIDLMQSLLDLAAARGLDVPQGRPPGDPPMDGMLSSAQMAALAAATGAEFERLWLEGMIYHHQGAIDMGYAQQRQQLATGRRPFGLSVLVEDIIVEQRAEITRMRGWLDAWGLSDLR